MIISDNRLIIAILLMEEATEEELNALSRFDTLRLGERCNFWCSKAESKMSEWLDRPKRH